MARDWFDEFFDQPWFIYDDRNQGARIRAKCLFFNVQVDQAFVVGPITIRPRDEENDRFRGYDDLEKSVLELNYVDRGPSCDIEPMRIRAEGRSLDMTPTQIQEAAFKTGQVLINTWCGISRVHCFNESNKLVSISGSQRFEPWCFYSPTQIGTLAVTDENKELFRKIFRANFGNLGHAIDRFGKACTEIDDESILDFVIALESTLGFGLHTEISHRISSRGAFLLSLDPSQRNRYYEIFKT